MISRGGSWLPRATPRRPPAPSRRSAAGPSTSQDARLPGEKAGPPRQLRRGERVARLVHQVAGCIRSLGQDPAAAHRFGHGLGPLPIPLDDRQPLDRLGVVALRLVACEPVEAEQRPLHERLGRLSGMQSAGAGPMDNGGDPAGADPPQRSGRFRRHGAHPIQREFLRLPQPHHQDPLHGKPPQGMNQRLFSPLPRGLARADQPADRAAQGGVHRGGRASKRCPAAGPRPSRLLLRPSADPLQQVDHQGITRTRRHIPCHHADIQSCLLSMSHSEEAVRLQPPESSGLSPEFSRQDRQERKDELGHSIAPDGFDQNLPHTPPKGLSRNPLQVLACFACFA
jgi:hypothetical protein